MNEATLIKNVTIYDGTGGRPFGSDVLIRDGLIHKVARFISTVDCKTIDGAGKILTPGFINCHSHCELYPFNNPQMLQSVGQGITTELVGQDGLSVAPIDDFHAAELTENMICLCGKAEKTFWWRSHADFMRLVEEQNPACRFVGLLGSGTIRMNIMGSENRPATTSEIRAMQDLIEQGMEEGARGLSFGLIYPPSSYASTEEMVEVCKAVAKHDGIIMVHMRSEMDLLLESFEEMVHIMKASGVRLEISHLKSLGPRNWGSVRMILDRMDELQAQGYDIGFDQYPWDAGSTGLKATVPDWAYSGGEDAFEARLADSAEYKRIYNETARILHNRGDGERVQIASIPESTEDFSWMPGLRIDEIAHRLGMDEVTAVLYILSKTRSSVLCVYHSISEDDVQAVMRSPWHVVCTDGIIGAVPHPRVYSSYPRFLGHYVRDMKIMPLETAVNHIAGEPARRLRLWDRGIIREGMSADLVLLDYERINATNSYVNPIKLPEGICKVWVKGILRYEEGMKL
ncbi:D-aminoacylase [Pyramidobacter sp. SM-530-WT-4B]|uniref:D-aminoacylase n=1 Tax=Pyramidobacter porci TaxID=2605789 RepID=A0A6L5YBH2_9BACT|nr:D-aminoacylase [Pyramidobacter porci]MST55686.1 D-aminoacylase [Pyramidobacter porci]